jgi:hypothetical protein
MIESARQALAFAEGRENHVCMAYIPEDIDLKTIWEKTINVSAGSISPAIFVYRQCRAES